MDVISGYCAVDVGGYWRGVIQGNLYCPQRRTNVANALHDAKELFAGRFKPTNKTTVEKCIIVLEEVGEPTRWGISLGSPNPDDDHYIEMPSKEKAFEVQEKVRKYLIDQLTNQS